MNARDAIANLAPFNEDDEPNVIIEAPKGSRNKYTYDEKMGLYKLGGVLPAGASFPFDFGFVPSTRGKDGDPLDIMILLQEPAHVGCLLDVRVIGVIEADQFENGERTGNDRVIAVAIHSYEHEEIKSISEMHGPVLDQVKEFFVTYNKSRGKKFKVKGEHGPKRAAEIVEQAIKAFEKNGKSASS